MTKKGDPASLANAVRGFRKPTPQARLYTIAGAKTDGLKRAQQLVKCRSFVYDGNLAPTCLKCGMPRQNRRLLKCDLCERAA